MLRLLLLMILRLILFSGILSLIVLQVLPELMAGLA